jgi:tape measure domain-containing protein
MAADTKIILSAEDKTRAAFDAAASNMAKLESAGSRLNGVLAAAGLGISTGAIIQMADDYANLQARLQLASRSSEEFAAANEAVQRIASASQAPLLETATLYTRIASSLKDTNVSQAEMVNTTEAVALSLRVSGASAQESASAMLQFSQAIAGGVLRGEEFNAVNESAPRLLTALASSLGVGVGQLREMAKEGKLTREVLIAGLAEQLPKLREEAEKMPKTLGAAFTELQNNMLLTIGSMNEMTGSGKTLADSLVEIGKPAITTFFQTLAVVGANVAYVFKQTGTEIGGMAAQVAALLSGDFKGASLIGDMMKADAATARKELDALEKRIMGMGKEVAKKADKPGAVTKAAVESAKDLLKGTLTDEQAQKMQSTLAKAFDDKALEDFLTSFQDKSKAIQAEYAKLKATLAVGPENENPTGLDISQGLAMAREASQRGDSAGASALLDRAKSNLTALAKNGAYGFEINYYADQLRDFELQMNAAAEQTAQATASAMRQQLEQAKNEIAQMDPLVVPIAADALANDLRKSIDLVRKELAANPLVIPTVVQQQNDLARAAAKLGAR